MTSSDAICLGGKVSETVNWKNPRGGGGGAVFGRIMRRGGVGVSPLEKSGDLMRVP